MTDMNHSKAAEARARALMRRGNHFAAQQEWGSAMTAFQEAQKELKSCTPSDKLRSYALAHLADATIQKLVGVYGLNQILNSAAIPALKKVEKLYEKAWRLNPKNAWALAHRAEVYRLIANCILDENGDFLDSRRLEYYERSIIYFCDAIELYLQTQGVGIAWACAHLGALLVNARVFIGISDKKVFEDFQKNTIERICKVAGLSMSVTENGISIAEWIDELYSRRDSWSLGDRIQICLIYLQAATKLLVRSLKSDGFYYPWAHAYYGASLLLQGALAQNHFSVDVATLGQVVTSHAYYLDPSLLTGVFEPSHLSVNPPFELALIHYAKAFLQGPSPNPPPEPVNPALECQRAWAFAWIALKWPFRFGFLEGLQTLMVCRLLAQISNTYIRLLPKGPIGSYDLLDVAGFGALVPSQSKNEANELDTQLKIINQRGLLNRFIDSAFSRFRRVQLDFILDKDIKLDSNLKTSLAVTLKVLCGLGCICTHSRTKDQILETMIAIRKRLGLKTESEFTWKKLCPENTLDNTKQNAQPFMFSLFTQDAVSMTDRSR
jgi:tetratricopeptide (TPR) repeat protein